MWGIPDWLTTTNSLKYVLTGFGTDMVYLGVALSALSQIAVFLFGAYKVRQMFLESED